MVQLTLDRRYVPPQIIPKRTNPFFTVVRTIERHAVSRAADDLMF